MNYQKISNDLMINARYIRTSAIHNSSYYAYHEINSNIEHTLKSTFNINSSDIIIAYFETRIMSGFKTGLVFTDNGVYYRPVELFGSSTKFTSHENSDSFRCTDDCYNTSKVREMMISIYNQQRNEALKSIAKSGASILGTLLFGTAVTTDVIKEINEGKSDKLIEKIDGEKV